jgi:mono/diheme cytochrome c family protein
MRNPLLLLPAALLVGYVASLTTAPVQAGSGQTSSKAGGEISTHVKTIYKVDCALCHGDNGDGKTDLATGMGLTLSDFTDPRTLQGKTDDQIFQLIRKGKDKMPPEEESRAKDAEVHSLILYIRNMSKGQPVPADAPASAPAAAPAETPAPAPAPSTAPGR